MPTPSRALVACPKMNAEIACANSTSTSASVRTLAAVAMAKAKNQNSEALPPMKPANDERTLAHRGQHRGGRADLKQRAGKQPGYVARTRTRPRGASERHDGGEEEKRERKSEQEAHMRRADRAEARGQFALQRVAYGLS